MNCDHQIIKVNEPYYDKLYWEANRKIIGYVTEECSKCQAGFKGYHLEKGKWEIINNEYVYKYEL